MPFPKFSKILDLQNNIHCMQILHISLYDNNNQLMFTELYHAHRDINLRLIEMEAQNYRFGVICGQILCRLCVSVAYHRMSEARNCHLLHFCASHLSIIGQYCTIGDGTPSSKATEWEHTFYQGYCKIPRGGNITPFGGLRNRGLVNRRFICRAKSCC